MNEETYGPSAVGLLHFAVDFEEPEVGAADQQVVDARLLQALFFQLGARIALNYKKKHVLLFVFFFKKRNPSNIAEREVA